MRSSIDLERGMLCLNADTRQWPGLASRRSHDAPGHRWATVEFPAVFAQALSTVIFLPRPLATLWCRARVTALVYEWSAISKERFKSSGVSVEPPEEAKKFLDRVMRDCQVDRPHIPLDPYPCDCLPIPMPY